MGTRFIWCMLLGAMVFVIAMSVATGEFTRADAIMVSVDVVWLSFGFNWAWRSEQ